MKILGDRVASDFDRHVGSDGLKMLDRLNATVFAIAKPSGCLKGIYRFKNHEDQNRFDEKLLVESMALRKLP